MLFLAQLRQLPGHPGRPEGACRWGALKQNALPTFPPALLPNCREGPAWAPPTPMCPLPADEPRLARSCMPDGRNWLASMWIGRTARSRSPVACPIYGATCSWFAASAMVLIAWATDMVPAAASWIVVVVVL
jgi:hypothetical protein